MAKSLSDLCAEMEKHRSGLFRYGLRMTGSISDAEDLTQDVFVIALRSYDHLQNEEHLKTWLYGIAHHRICRMLRRRKLEGLFRPSQRSSSQFESSTILVGLILELPVRQRDPFVLVKIEGLTCEQASQVIGIPVGTVKYRIHEAVTALRKCFVEESVKVEEPQHVI